MQEENGDVLFGTSVVGGFNRRNVLAYIGQLQNRLSAKDAAADERDRSAQQELCALRDKAHSLEQALARANADKESLEDALSRANADRQALELSFTRVQKENDMLRGQLNDARSDLQRLRSARPTLRKGK